MDADNVFPAEMPDDHLQPLVPKPMVPLDDDTAERLLAGHLHPEDAPPGYAEVARVLQAAAGPPAREELAGEEAALAGFRAAGRGPTVAAGRRAPTGAGGRRRRTRMRASLVALALAGTLVVGGVWLGGGVWTADGALTALGLRSPSGGPGTGGAGGAGSLRPVTTPVTGGRAPGLPSAGERAAARHGRGVTSRGGGSAYGHRVGAHGEPPRPESPEAKPPKASKDKPGRTKPPKGPGGQAAED
ncbi:MAG: hypothetical protein ACJ75E_11475 [Actinomycetes bacterium]